MRGVESRWIARVMMTNLLLIMGALMTTQASAQTTPSSSASAVGHRPEDILVGEWWTENNEGRIEFARYRDGTFRGTTRCCRPKRETSESPTKDIHNPNPKLRDRPTIGIVIIWKLVYGDGEYSGGYIYNPRDGNTYHINVSIIDRDTIKIRGYIAIPLLGQSQVWKRARNTELVTTQQGAQELR